MATHYNTQLTVTCCDEEERLAVQIYLLKAEMLVIKKHNNGYFSKNSEMKNTECLQTQLMTNYGGFCSQNYSINVIVIIFCLRKY